MIFDEHLTGSNSLSPMSYLVADISELSSRQKPQAKIKTIFRKAAEQNFRSFPPPKLWLIFELWSLNWVKQSCHQRLLNGVNQARLFEPGYVWSVPSKRFIKVLKIFDYDVQSLAMWAQGKPSKNTDVFYIFSEIFFSKEQSTINGLEVMFLSNYLKLLNSSCCWLCVNWDSTLSLSDDSLCDRNIKLRNLHFNAQYLHIRYIFNGVDFLVFSNGNPFSCQGAHTKKCHIDF